jgi:phage gpG-like protein
MKGFLSYQTSFNMPDYFKLKFSIEGVTELSRVLAQTHQKVENLKQPLQASAEWVLRDVETQFRTSGGLTGGWKPLANPKATHPILQVTGALRRSFYSLVDEKKAIISSNSPYFVYHQSRLPRKKLPRRAMLVLTEYTKQNIVEEFHKFLRFT